MSSPLRIVAQLCLAVAASGCGLVFLGTTQRVKVTTTPDGATVSVLGQTITAPGEISVRRREWTVFRATKEGYQPACQLVGARRNKLLAVLDSIPVGLGWIVDRPTEALRSYPTEIHFMLAPASPETPASYLATDEQIIRNRRRWGGMCSPPAPILTARGAKEVAPVPGLVSVHEEARGVSWNGITVGTTTREEVEEQHGSGRTEKGGVRYGIEGVQVVIRYDQEDAVQTIRVKPPTTMDEHSVVAAYGKASNERRSETFRRLWDYPDAGMTVEFGPDGRTVAAVEYHALGAAAKGGRREPPPIVEARPPLHDIARHQANIQLALSQTGRSFNWVSSSEEYQGAQQSLAAVADKGLIETDTSIQRYVQEVLDRLAAVTPQGPYPWVVRVLQVQEFNACNAGGGMIFINRGLFRYLETEAQLAYVIGHEMGHQLKGHVSAKESKRRLANILVAAGIGVARDPQLAATAGGIAARATLAAFSRGQEVEADRIGLNILNEAGYDPREASKAARIMVQVDASGGAPAMFAAHPDPVERLANVQGWIGTAWDADYSDRIVSTREFENIKAECR